jgi:hypothetical protein
VDNGEDVMAFKLSVASLPPLENYEQAKKKYESITPIRGSNNVRPLGDRRYGHTRYITEGNGGEYYAACLYRTECVRYYRPEVKDGVTTERIEVRHGRWDTVSTAAFLDRVLPSGLRAEKTNNAVRINGYAIGVDKHENGLLVLESINGAKWEIKNFAQEVIHKINRKRKAQVLKRHAPFLQWAKAYLSLMEDKISEQDLVAARGEVATLIKAERYARMRQTASLMLANEHDSDQFAKYQLAVALIAQKEGSLVWRGGVATDRTRVLYHNQLAEFICKLYARELLDEVKLEPGEIKADKYKSWLRDALAVEDTQPGKLDFV